MVMRTKMFCLFAALLPSVASAQSVVTKEAFPGARNLRVIYYDNSFLFMARHYGSDRDVGGNTEPGLFVHSKAHDRWLQIVEVPTKDGKFGKSSSDDPVEKEKLKTASVGWDFTGYAKKPSIALPLKASGSIAFPDKMELDAATDRYKISFFTSWEVESAVTRLYLSRTELTAQFDKDSKR